MGFQTTADGPQATKVTLSFSFLDNGYWASERVWTVREVCQFVQKNVRILTWLEISNRYFVWRTTHSLRSDPPLLELPASLLRPLAACTELERLDLSFHALSEIPDQIGALPKLEKLWIEHNKLSRLPPSLATWPSLKELFFTGRTEILENFPPLFVHNSQGNPAHIYAQKASVTLTSLSDIKLWAQTSYEHFILPFSSCFDFDLICLLIIDKD